MESHPQKNLDWKYSDLVFGGAVSYVTQLDKTLRRAFRAAGRRSTARDVRPHPPTDAGAGRAMSVLRKIRVCVQLGIAVLVM